MVTEGDIKGDLHTRRLVRACEDPQVDIIDHPTTHLIGKRPGIDAYLDEVFAACARTGTAPEIVAQPDRVDLGDEDIPSARSHGVKSAIDTDAHSIPQLAYLRYGVGTAQRMAHPRRRHQHLAAAAAAAIPAQRPNGPSELSAHSHIERHRAGSAVRTTVQRQSVQRDGFRRGAGHRKRPGVGHLEYALHAAVDGGEFHVDRDLAHHVQPVDDLVQERDEDVLVPLRPYFHVPAADTRRPRQV